MGETVTLNIKLKAFVRRETKARWVAVCPRLDVASQGRTEEDAKRSLWEAVHLWFESCIERGVLDQAMRELNFRPMSPDELPAASEHVLVNRRTVPDEEDDDVRGGLFRIDIEIPAYQAAAFLQA